MVGQCKPVETKNIQVCESTDERFRLYHRLEDYFINKQLRKCLSKSLSKLVSL